MHRQTLMMSIAAGVSLGYRLSRGSSSLASGSLIPMNRGLRLKISRCLAIR